MLKKSSLFLLTMVLFWQSSWANSVISIQLKRFQKEFSIVLPENPTTGYTWSILHMDKKQLALMQKEYQANSNTRIGSGGKVFFTFKVLPDFKDETELSLNLRRPWEKTKGQVKNYHITKEQVAKK